MIRRSVVRLLHGALTRSRGFAHAGQRKREVRDGHRTYLFEARVSGFEYKVLQGAERFLARIAGIQIELSLVPLYDGEHLFHPMLHGLEERGYDLWSVVPGFVGPETGRLLQLDAIFFRKEPVIAN